MRRRGGRKRALEPGADWRSRRSEPALEPGLRLRRAGDGRRFRVLVVVDDFTRECLALVVDTSLSGARVARELDHLGELRGLPLMIVSDNGTELTSRAILVCRQERGVNGTTSRRASRWQKRVRREPERPLPRRMPPTSTASGACTRPDGSRSLAVDYNTRRPHTSLGGLTPDDSPTGPDRTTTRTESGYERGQSGGKVKLHLP